jgi:hypothetical protein
MPATAEGISRYLTFLAGHGAKVGTMSRRLSGIRFAHRMRDLPDPTAAARVIAVWEGIRRTHGAPPDQASPLMPPELWDVIDRCPTTRTWKIGKRPPEPDLAGFRDRALLLVGFVAALRRSELTALTRRPGRRTPQRTGARHRPIKDQPDRRASRARRPAPSPHGQPLPGVRGQPCRSRRPCRSA